MASFLQKTPQMKRKAEGDPALKKMQQSTPSGLLSDISELLQLMHEEMVDDKK